LKIEKCPDK